VHEILIVEDEAVIAQGLKVTMEQAGFKVLGIAASEDQAVRLVKEKRPDVALVDIRLRRDSASPGRLAGLRLAEELWICDRVPVILVTAFPELVTQAVAEKSGVFGVVSKPITNSTLIAQINIALERSAEAPYSKEKPPRPLH
jgi:1,2-diacylglycerol 3-beta-glucosyltransferase